MDPRVKAVYEWLRNHYSLEENPGMGEEGLYYYYHTMAKALHAYGAKVLPLKDGKEVNWRHDLAKRLLDKQSGDGFWQNETGRWWEKGTEIDILATDQEGKHYLVGECKFRTTPFDLADLNALLGKFKPDKRGARVYYCLFSRTGFTSEVRKAAKDQGIELVELDRML